MTPSIRSESRLVATPVPTLRSTVTSIGSKNCVPLAWERWASAKVRATSSSFQAFANSSSVMWRSGESAIWYVWSSMVVRSLFTL